MSALTLIVTGDLHVCDRPTLAGMRPVHALTGEPLYLAHARRTLAWIAGVVADAPRPVAVLVGGDLFDSPAPSPAAMAVVVEWLVQLTDADGVSVHLLLGNHDRESGSDRAHALEPLRHLRPGRVFVVDRPAAFALAAGVTVYPIPYPSRAQIARWAGGAPEATNEAISAALNALVEGYAASATLTSAGNPSALSLLWGHGTLGGASFGSRTVPLTDPQVDAALQLGFDLSLWSHIHLRQPVGAQGQSFRGYVGAPDRFDFGEADQPASILRVDCRPGLREFRVLENPAARTYRSYDAEQFLEPAWLACFRADVERELEAERAGSDARRSVVRVVGLIPAEVADEVQRRVRSLKAAGALIVDRTEVARPSRARVEIGADYTPSTVLEAVFEARPDLADRADTIRGHVADLEAGR